MGKQRGFWVSFIAGTGLLLAGGAFAADYGAPQGGTASGWNVHAYRFPGWFGSWSYETGLPARSYVTPPYAGPYGFPYLPTGYAITRYDGAPPHCVWVTRRTNGYGGRILVWPVGGCS